MEYAIAMLVVVVALALWSLNLFGVPGNWLIVAEMVIYAKVLPLHWRLEVGNGVLVGLILFAIAGEAVEFLASAMGASRAGGSKRSAALAMLGSLAGGLFGIFAGGGGIPIPVVGSVLGAFLFASLGAFAGALIGEQWKGRGLDDSMRVGQAAFWARLFGTVGKIVMGAVMIVLVIVSLLI